MSASRYLLGPVAVEEDGRRCPCVDYGSGPIAFPFHNMARCTSVNSDNTEALIVLPGNDRRPVTAFPGWMEINEATYIDRFTTNEGRAPEAHEK